MNPYFIVVTNFLRDEKSEFYPCIETWYIHFKIKNECFKINIKTGHTLKGHNWTGMRRFRLTPSQHDDIKLLSTVHYNRINKI